MLHIHTRVFKLRNVGCMTSRVGVALLATLPSATAHKLRAIPSLSLLTRAYLMASIEMGEYP